MAYLILFTVIHSLFPPFCMLSFEIKVVVLFDLFKAQSLCSQLNKIDFESIEIGELGVPCELG